jgi:hypothetical protein
MTLNITTKELLEEFQKIKKFCNEEINDQNVKDQYYVGLEHGAELLYKTILNIDKYKNLVESED